MIDEGGEGLPMYIAYRTKDGECAAGAPHTSVDWDPLGRSKVVLITNSRYLETRCCTRNEDSEDAAKCVSQARDRGITKQV
jgi:hypothetical protein